MTWLNTNWDALLERARKAETVEELRLVLVELIEYEARRERYEDDCRES